MRAERWALRYAPPTIILEYTVLETGSRRHLTLQLTKLTPRNDPSKVLAVSPARFAHRLFRPRPCLPVEPD